MSKYETLNKGEWSEVYAFLRILADARLNGSDENLNILDDSVAALSIAKNQINTELPLTYSLKENSISLSGCKIDTKDISRSIISQKADLLLSRIRSNVKRTFKVEEISLFLKNFGNPILKEKVDSKKDITIRICEPSLNNPILGFSIKSNLSNNSTLLNASTGTNFTYRISDPNETLYRTLAPYKAKALVGKIDDSLITFERVNCDVYSYNLSLIDTQFSRIIALVLLNYFQKKGNTILELLDIVKKCNPLNLSDVEIYTSKMEDFLLATALGMVPKTRWDNSYKADGGMIVVKEDGAIATFYIYKCCFLHYLRRYLLNHSYLDTPSVSRHKFGKLKKDDNGIYLNLNLQIRLK